MVDHLQKITLISLIILTLLTGASASDWEFQPLEEPYNNQNFSVNTSNVFLTHLENRDGEEITPEYIENYDEEGQDTSSSPYVVYEYDRINASSGDVITVNRSLMYNHNLEAWVAEFEPNYEGMDSLELKAQGNAEEDGGIDSDGESTAMLDAEVSDVNINLLDDRLEINLLEPLKAGIQDKFDLRTLDITEDNEPIGQEDIDVDLYFHNASAVDNLYNVNNYNDDSLEEGGQYHFNSEINLPDEPDSTYVMRINSTTTEGEESSHAMIIETAEAIEGEIRDLDGSGCNDDFTQCEPEADINTTFDIVNADAEQVNMTLHGVNQSTGTAENITDSIEMEEVEAFDGAEQTFESSLQIPDINTSEFERGLELEFFAWNDQRTYSENHSIDLETFTVDDRSSPTAFKERSHEIRLRLGKMFSLDSYNKSRFDEIEVTLEGPDSEFEQVFTQDDLEYSESDGVMTTDVVIPGGEESGTYTLTTSATDIYGENKEFSSGLTVRDLDATFTAQDSLDLEYSSLGEFVEPLTLENLADSEKTIQIDSDSEDLLVPEEVILESGEEDEVDIGVNLTSPEDFEGEIEFTDTDTNYNESTTVTVNAPNCELVDNNLCVDQGSLDFSVDEQEPVERTLGVINLGEDAVEIENSLNGNISDHVSVESNMSITDSETLELSFDPSAPGNYSGDLVMTGNDSEVSVNLSAEADFEGGEPELSASPTSINLGTLPEGESTTQEVTIENTGNTLVEDIQPVSDDYNFDIDSFSLDSGDEQSVELLFDSFSGSNLAFTGQSSGEDVTVDLSVDADVIDDYSGRTDELQDRVNDLQGQTDDQDIDDRLVEVSSMVDQVDAQWDEGDYEQSRDTFEDAQGRLDEIEIDIQTQDSDDPGNGRGSGESNGQDTGGGLPIIPIAMILLVLSIVGGFIFYESYIPEEGDPLYGVMG